VNLVAQNPDMAAIRTVDLVEIVEGAFSGELRAVIRRELDVLFVKQLQAAANANEEVVDAILGNVAITKSVTEQLDRLAVTLASQYLLQWDNQVQPPLNDLAQRAVAFDSMRRARVAALLRGRRKQLAPKGVHSPKKKPHLKKQHGVSRK